jgi:hypothetical protein
MSGNFVKQIMANFMIANVLSVEALSGINGKILTLVISVGILIYLIGMKSKIKLVEAAKAVSFFKLEINRIFYVRIF